MVRDDVPAKATRGSGAPAPGALAPAGLRPRRGCASFVPSYGVTVTASLSILAASARLTDAGILMMAFIS